MLFFFTRLIHGLYVVSLDVAQLLTSEWIIFPKLAVAGLNFELARHAVHAGEIFLGTTAIYRYRGKDNKLPVTRIIFSFSWRGLLNVIWAVVIKDVKNKIILNAVKELWGNIL